MENTQDLRILEKNCYYKVLNSQQFKEDADCCFSSIEELEERIDKNSDFIYIKILTIAVSNIEDVYEAKIEDSIPFIEVDCNAEYLDNNEVDIGYEIEVWGNFDNSCFEGGLAETGEYEKVTDLSFMDRLEKFDLE